MADKEKKEASANATPKTLAQRIHAIMSDVDYIQKGEKRVNQQYRYVSHDQVMEKLHPLFVRHGVIMLAKVENHQLETINSINRTIVTVSLNFINIDDPNDAFVTTSIGYGLDTQDKGVGKAISYAVKYGLLKTFMLETGEDPDDDQREPEERVAPAAKPAEKPKTEPPKAEPKPQPALAEKPAPVAAPVKPDSKQQLVQPPVPADPLDTKISATVKTGILTRFATVGDNPKEVQGWLENYLGAPMDGWTVRHRQELKSLLEHTKLNEDVIIAFAKFQVPQHHLETYVQIEMKDWTDKQRWTLYAAARQIEIGKMKPEDLVV